MPAMNERKVMAKMAGQGSAPTGPSEAYLELLKGKISPREYTEGVKQRVKEQRKNGSSGRANGSAARRRSG